MPGRVLRPVLVLLLLALFTSACAAGLSLRDAPSPRPQGTTSAPGIEGVQPATRVTYGEHPSQWVDVMLPGPLGDGPYPTVAFLHGGFWYEGYGAELMDDLVADALARGFATANVEYRRINGGGGYPQTFEDVATALDSLAGVPGIDAARVAVAGHSAGGHLALWAGSREQLPAGSPGASPGLLPCGVVGQAPVADLVGASLGGLGGGAVQALLGGGPDELPDAYAAADPSLLVGGDVPVLLVHGARDGIVPPSQSASYADLVEAAGGTVALQPFDGGHFDVLDPRQQNWIDAMAWIRTTCAFAATG